MFYYARAAETTASIVSSLAHVFQSSLYTDSGRPTTYIMCVRRL